MRKLMDLGCAWFVTTYHQTKVFKPEELLNDKGNTLHTSDIVSSLKKW